MKKMKVAAIIAAIVFVSTCTVFAQPQGKQDGRREEGRGKVFKELKLTPEQEKKLEENRRAQHQDMVRLHDALKEKHTRLQAKISEPGVTKAAVIPLLNEIKSLQGQMLEKRMDGIFAVKSILTPEQFARFRELMEKQFKNKKGRPGGRFQGSSQGRE